MTDTTNAPMAQAFTTTFHPSTFAHWLPKFSRPTTPEWTVGVMEYIVAALDGVPCLVEADSRTGHTVLAYLISTRHNGPGRLPTLTLRYHHGENCTSPRPLPDGREQAACRAGCRGYHDTAHYLQGIGTITPLPVGRERVPSTHDVTRVLFDHGAKVMSAVWEAMKSETPGLTWYGKCENRPSDDGTWHVSFTSQVRDGQEVPKGYADPYQAATFTVNPTTGAWTKGVAYDYRRRSA